MIRRRGPAGFGGLAVSGIWVLGAVLIGPESPAADPVDRAGLRDARLAIRAAEAAALERLAVGLKEDGRADEAGRIRGLVEPTPPIDGPRRFEPLPEVVPPADPSPSYGDDPIEAEVDAARERAADSYAELACLAFEADRLALADACLREVIRRRPDDPEARRVLGYVPHEGGWATPHAVLRLSNGDVLDEQYGWIPADWPEQLELGLLPAPTGPGRRPTRWIPANEADALRQRNITSGWAITTPHFKIQASVPLAEGIDFARRLEAFYDLFTSIVADVIGPERLPTARLFRDPEATPPPKAPRQHQVLYFGTKQQYVDYLAPRLRDPSIGETLGVYLDDRKISYFFKDEGGELPVEATLYHEVSHQLLFELAGPSGYQRNAGNYWVFEGLGTYFETVEHQDDGSLRYGGRVGPRVEEARRRIVELQQAIPIERFVTFDRAEFNDRDRHDPHLHYAQAIALTVYLMDGDLAAHRDAFLDYTADAYRGQLRDGSARSLASHLGTSYGALDQSLRDFLATPEGSADE